MKSSGFDLEAPGPLPEIDRKHRLPLMRVSQTIKSQCDPGLNEPAALVDSTLVPSISQIAGVPSLPCQMMSDLPSPLKSPVP
jgi:hypothetical protein